MEALKRTTLEVISPGEKKTMECVIFIDPTKEVVGLRIPTPDLKAVTWQVPLKDFMEVLNRVL